MISFKAAQWQTFSLVIIPFTQWRKLVARLLGAAAVHSQAAVWPSLFCFFMTRSDRAGNMNAWEALFYKTRNLDKEKSGPCGVNRLSVKQEVTPL